MSFHDLANKAKMVCDKTGLVSPTDIDILDYVFSALCSRLDTNEIAFKGGYVLNKIIKNEQPRDTVDIDLSIRNKEYYYDVIKTVLGDIASNLLDDGIIESFKVDEDIEETRTGGIKLYRSVEKRTALGLDIGLHDVDSFVAPITINGFSVKIFSVERMLADKFTAIFSYKRFRRPKDLYDFYIITNCNDIDMNKFRGAIDMRGEVDWDANPFTDDVMVQYKKAYESLDLFRSSRGSNVESKAELPPFSVVLDRVRIFTEFFNSGIMWDCSSRQMV